MDGGVPVLLGVSDEVLLVVSDDVPLVDAVCPVAAGATAIALRVGIRPLVVAVGPELFAGVVEEEEEVTAGITVREP